MPISNEQTELDGVLEGYLRQWPDVQNEISASPYGSFFKNWSPEIFTRSQSLTIPELWALMDKAWDENLPKNESDILKYYAHPVWWLNAKIEETDRISIKHRLIAVNLARAYHPRKALDRGGGYGLLTRMAYQLLPDVEIHLEDVIDSEAASAMVADLERVRVVAKSEPPYDVIWSIEVIEHLTDPIREIYDLNHLLRIGGALITSYSFYPMIKCHLPQNYYLRHAFHRLVPLLGFRLARFERPSVTVWVFEKTQDCSKTRFALVRLLTACLHPMLLLANALYPTLRQSK